jgi:GNAT superfamily N-acetyltransferase
LPCQTWYDEGVLVHQRGEAAVLTVEPVLDVPTLTIARELDAEAYDHDFVALPADPVEEAIPGLGGVEIAGSRTFRYLAREGGAPVGTVSIDLPTLDNLTAANIDGLIHPAHRRRGLGRELLAWSVDEARRMGRGRLWFQVPAPVDGTDGVAEPLMREVGARLVLEEARRLLDLQSVALLDRSHVAAGYRLEQWVDSAPEELLDGLAYLNSRMSTDAPNGDMDLEQEVWDAGRVRAKEESGRQRGRLHMLTVAVHEATGVVAGLTEIAVSRSRPYVGYQWETIVDPEHRGHRLGLALKTWNHHFLAEHSPQTRYVNTWNADSNSFMVSVNEACGFTVAERWNQYQLDL